MRPAKPRKLLRFLEQEGFIAVSQRGSHVKMRHADGRVAIVPVHAGQDLKVGIVRAILKDARIDPRRFQ